MGHLSIKEPKGIGKGVRNQIRNWFLTPFTAPEAQPGRVLSSEIISLLWPTVSLKTRRILSKMRLSP